MSYRPNFSFERKFWKEGFQFVAGVDEVGRGAWAGPLFAAAVVFPPQVRLGKKINESKKLSPSRRNELAELVKGKALAWAIGTAGVGFINRRGIVRATEAAMREALKELDSAPEFVLVDYYKLSFWPEEKQLPLKFGDQLSTSIAAASILAKVARDNHMTRLAEEYPGYGFEFHVGYGTKEHRSAIRERGPCAIHRLAFIPEKLL